MAPADSGHLPPSSRRQFHATRRGPDLFAGQGPSTIAIQSAAERRGTLAALIDTTIQVMPVGFAFDALGMIADADHDAAARFDELARAWARAMPSLAPPPAPGTVVAGPPRTGIFVVPDNHAPGTLEDVVLEAGALSYPSLLNAAEAFVASALTTPDLNAAERRETDAPAGRKKATLAAVVALLKPGKAVQTSLQDDRWLGATPRVAALGRFIASLCGFPTT